jgi:hypothetical protein
MTFVTLDDKDQCIGYYRDGEMVLNENYPSFLRRTWKYHKYLKNNKNIEYANLYVGGKDFSLACPENLKDQWDILNQKAKSFVRSFVESKVSLKENCFYDLVPESFLIKYCDIKCEIINHIIDNNKKPINYDYLLDLEKTLTDIKYQKLNLDFNNLKSLDQKTKDFVQKYENKECFISYNQFGSKTGRLVTEDNSFPILTMNKKYRSVIQPNNDFFLEIDYNAAEIRTFLALSGQNQPDIDIHEWNMEKFNFKSREEAKLNFIAWLYGKKHEKEDSFKKIYNTEYIKNKYWNGNIITNYYGKQIESDEFHALNYIVQSTAANIALKQTNEVFKLLENYKSKISMIIHDSIVIDVKKEEKHLINNIIKTYTMTEFGKFKASVKVGKDLNEMRKIL